MSRDTANINDQLGEDPDVFPLLNANYNEALLIEEQSTLISSHTLGSAWIVGTSTNAIVGTNTGTVSGNQQVVGDADRILTVNQVINKNNIFRERFRFNVFEDTTNTTAYWDTTNNYIKFNLNQTAQSVSVYKGNSTVIKAKLTVTSSNITASYYLSANGGSNWESVTSGTQHTFTNTGTDLRFKATTGDIYDSVLSMTQIDSMDAITDWNYTPNTTISVNSTTFKEGTGSVNVNKTGVAAAFAGINKTLGSQHDFTGKSVYLWLYVKDATEYAKLQVTGSFTFGFGNDNSNYYTWSVDKADISIGWNLIGPFNTDNISSTTGSPSLTTFDFVQARLFSVASATTWTAGSYMIDDIELVTPGTISYVQVDYV